MQKRQGSHPRGHHVPSHECGTLNMGVVDTDMCTVSITGKEAYAEVEVRPKNAAPQDAGMQVAYNRTSCPRAGPSCPQRAKSNSGQ